MSQIEMSLVVKQSCSGCFYERQAGKGMGCCAPDFVPDDICVTEEIYLEAQE